MKKLSNDEFRDLTREFLTADPIGDEDKRLHEHGGRLNEQWGSAEALSPLVAFAQAWSGLGGAVQEQMIDVTNGFIENNKEAVYEINPNALDMAIERLAGPLDAMRGDTEAEELMGALDWAKEIFEQGDAEVDADARAAGDR